MAFNPASMAALWARWEGDRVLGYGLCRTLTQAGKPCTHYACGPHGKCRTHKRRKNAKRQS